MTSYTNLSDATLTVGKPVTQSVARALRDNPLAIGEAATGAPKVVNAAIYDFTSGAVLQAFSDGEVSTGASSYTKVKEIYVPRAGVLTVEFMLKGTDGSQKGRIYKNGAAVGTERTFSALSLDGDGYMAVFSEDITVAAGDALQIYLKSAGGPLAYAKKFRLKATSLWQFVVTI